MRLVHTVHPKRVLHDRQSAPKSPRPYKSTCNNALELGNNREIRNGASKLLFPCFLHCKSRPMRYLYLERPSLGHEEGVG